MTKQVDIKSFTYRQVYETPGHVTYGFWINGGKCGELTVRQEEKAGFLVYMRRGGFTYTELAGLEQEDT